MSLEGTIRDLGLHEVGQLLSLSRKSGTLAVSSVLRARSAWIRFADGAMVDAGVHAPLASGEATAAAAAGERSAVEEVVLDVLAWREGRFVFNPEASGSRSASHVRIPTDAMLVESARRDDAWQQLADRVPDADVVPSFVDYEPRALPLLRLVPQEWEVLTRVDGQRSLRILAHLLRREVLEVAGIVYGLIATGLLSVRDSGPLRRATAPEHAVLAPMSDVELPAPRVAGRAPDLRAERDDLWVPVSAEMAVFDSDHDDADDVVFDPLRAGLLTPHGSPRVEASSFTSTPNSFASSATTVTPPASWHVASGALQPSSPESPIYSETSRPVDLSALLEQGNEAARRGDFESALTYWSHFLRHPHANGQADRVREAIGLAARLQALLYPMAVE